MVVDVILRGLAGQLIADKYRLKTFVGGGSMAAVYEADHVVDDVVLRSVALRLVANPRKEELFCLGLEHPSILRTYDLGRLVFDGANLYYFALELATETLEEHIERAGTLSEEDLRGVVGSIGKALQFLHGLKPHPIVHRDVKPSNILKVGSDWKLGDFGTIRHLERSQVLTAGVGTPYYAPPESFRSISSVAWDAWSLGVTIARCACGKYPFEAGPAQDNMAALMYGILTEPPSLGALDAPWNDIVNGLLQKDFTTRWSVERVLAVLGERASGKEGIRANVRTDISTANLRIELDRSLDAISESVGAGIAPAPPPRIARTDPPNEVPARALPPQAIKTPFPGLRFGKYEVISTIHDLGYLIIYRARDSVLGREVWIHCLKGSSADNPETRDRHLLQARVGSNVILHQNLLKVLDFEHLEGRGYLVTEALDGGRSLLDRVNHRELRDTDRIAVLRGVAGALRVLHQGPAVHRNVAPENVFVSNEGRVVLGNLVTVGVESLELTRPGFAIGPEGWFAPEVAIGQKFSAKSDVYQFGLLGLFVWGMLPRAHSSMHFAWPLHAATTPAIPRHLSIEGIANQWLVPILKRCLQKEVRDRPTIEVVCEALEGHRQTTG
jgi:serine/threonine protein kinase